MRKQSIPMQTARMTRLKNCQKSTIPSLDKPTRWVWNLTNGGLQRAIGDVITIGESITIYSNKQTSIVNFIKKQKFLRLGCQKAFK